METLYAFLVTRKLLPGDIKQNIMKKNWKLWEKELANDFGGNRVKGSGSQWYSPGDVRSSKDLNLLIEAKHTENKSFSITKALWEKISDEALFSKKYPVLAIQIKNTKLLVFS